MKNKKLYMFSVMFFLFSFSVVTVFADYNWWGKDGDWVEKVSLDFCNDGIVDSVYTNTYDRNGNVLKCEYDNNNSGTISSVCTYTYDSTGNLIKKEYDNNINGTIDSVYTY
ncbi:MAG: hypothetical protein GY756_01315, partial [bacterium]|nr:hypothetical protein [bacterium]